MRRHAFPVSPRSIYGLTTRWATPLKLTMEEAVLSGDLELVQELIRRGADVNDPCTKPIEEGSLLILAIKEGDRFKDISLALVTAGADVHAKDTIGRTALHWACAMGLKEIVQVLINKEIRVNEPDDDGCTPLMLAQKVFTGNDADREAISMCLLQAGASCTGLPFWQVEDLCHNTDVHNLLPVPTLFKNDFSVSTLSREEQVKLLHHACHEGDVPVVRTLLKNGCSIGILTMKEKKKLIQHACREGDVSVVCTLLKSGCMVSSLSREEQEKLLHHACCSLKDGAFVACTLIRNGCKVSSLCREEQEMLLSACHKTRGGVFVAQSLLKNGCSISNLSREAQEGLLRHACRDAEGGVLVAHSLLKSGCRISCLSREEQNSLLHHECHSLQGDVFVAHSLLKSGCMVSSLFREEQAKLLHRASRDSEGGVFVAHSLLKNGCSISILSGEEQAKLLHHACHYGGVLVAHSLLKNGCDVSILSTEERAKLLHHVCHTHDSEGGALVAHSLLKNGCRVSSLSREEQEKLLHHACCECDVYVVEVLLAEGCNIDCMVNGYTPLMDATQNGHEEIVKKLVLAGANIHMQDAECYNTAFHFAATCNNIQCGILLVEGGADVKAMNNLALTPLDLAKPEFQEAIVLALSFVTRKTFCVIGNAEGGKSTLIAALQAERNSFWGKIINRFRRVGDRRQRTAGIETIPYCSERYGEVLFFDFAGQDDYHGPHQMFLESLLSKQGVSMTLLLVVKLTEEEEAILYQLHRWLSPVALMGTIASPPRVIVIGSFLDKVKSKQEATAKLTRCMETTRKDLKELPLEFVGYTFLNCRQPQSEGIDQLCYFLQEIPTPEFRATHTRYSLAWVLSQIRLSFTAQAVQLQEFSTWIQDNKENLPQTMPSPEEVCQDLSAAGHALYLPNKEDLPKSWLVLNLPSILHDVYGTLFSQSNKMVNEFGLLHYHNLAKLFPQLELKMVQQLLISLEFCIPVDPTVLKVELSELTQGKEASGWLFFPALICTKPPQSALESFTQQGAHYLCWQLRTSKKHSVSAHLLQTILLRLAAQFVVKQHDKDGIQQHYCSIWWNGIAWQSTIGVDVIVHIINNRLIQVIGASLTSADKAYQYLTDVISAILSTVLQLSPKLAARAYIVHPPKIATLSEGITVPSPKELFPVEGIRSSIREHKDFSLSLKDSDNHWNMMPVTDLFGGRTPSLEDIERINWTQPEPNQSQSPAGPHQPDVLSWTVYSEFILQCAFHFTLYCFCI